MSAAGAQNRLRESVARAAWDPLATATARTLDGSALDLMQRGADRLTVSAPWPQSRRPWPPEASGRLYQRYRKNRTCNVLK